jgi:hypothetical protein
VFHSPGLRLPGGEKPASSESRFNTAPISSSIRELSPGIIAVLDTGYRDGVFAEPIEEQPVVATAESEIRSPRFQLFDVAGSCFQIACQAIEYL